jgi:hypothetical protein
MKSASKADLSVCVLLNKVNSTVNLSAWSAYLRLEALSDCCWYDQCTARIIAINSTTGSGVLEALEWVLSSIMEGYNSI